MPPIEGINLPGVLSLRNVPDMDRIIAYIDENNPSTRRRDRWRFHWR
jgi:hypothetical protein